MHLFIYLYIYFLTDFNNLDTILIKTAAQSASFFKVLNHNELLFVYFLPDFIDPHYSDEIVSQIQICF